MLRLSLNLDRFDPLTVTNTAAGVENHFFAFFQSFQDLSFGAAGPAHFESPQARPAIGHDEARPFVAASKQSAGWHFEGIVGFPNDDFSFDTKIVADGAPLIRSRKQIDDHVDPLFFDA